MELDMEASRAAVSATSPMPASTSHGRACLNCARAKARCIRRQHVLICERCDRMKKICEPGPKLRKRRTVKKTPMSKNALIEEKLDDLVMLLKSATQPKTLYALDVSSPTSNPFSGNQPLEAMVQSLSEIRRTPGTRNQPSMQVVTPAESSSAVSDSTRASEPQSHDFLPSPEEAEIYFRRCRNFMLGLFPAIVIPNETTSGQLREAKPFLWRCLMIIGCRRLAQQRAMMDDVRRTIGHELVFEGNKSIDLLQGLLIYISWWHYYRHRKQMLTILVQLAMAVVYDLGLNRPAHSEPNKPKRHALDSDEHCCNSRPLVRTMEERRAFVGCYVISSCLSNFLGEMHPMRRTAYLEETVQILTETPEVSSDILLAQHARLQLLEDNISQAPWSEDADTSNVSKAPAFIYLQSYQHQLEGIKNQFPCVLRENEMLRLHCYHVEIKVHDLALHSNCQLPNATRLEALYICMQATQSFYEVYFGLERGKHTTLPYVIFTQLSYALSAIRRLLTFLHPIWGLAACRQAYGGGTCILDRMIALCSMTRFDNPEYDVDEGSVFAMAAQKMISVRTGWEAKIAEAGGVVPEPQVNASATVDVMDASWVQDALGPFDLPIESWGDYRWW